MGRKRKGSDVEEGSDKRQRDSDTNAAEAKEETFSIDSRYSTTIREQIVKMTSERGIEKTC